MPYPETPEQEETSILERSKLESIKIGSDEKRRKVRKAAKRMDFVSLHHHSTYSFLDGYGHPSEHVDRAVELGMSAMALTEHGNTSSHVKLEAAAKEAGIKPIFGCELYAGIKKPSRKKNHLTVWAEDEDGYKNLLRMVSQAWGPDFYSEPTVEGWNFRDHQRGLVVASGCLGSLLATSIVGGKHISEKDASFKRGLEVAQRFRELLDDRYYLEVQAFPQLDATCLVNPALERIGQKLGIPLVATADVHYPLPEHAEMQTILHAVRPGSKRSFEEQAKAWGYDVSLAIPQSDRGILERLGKTGLSRKAALQAVRNTREISDRCTVELPKAPPLKYPSRVPSRKLFRRWLRDGWHFRNIDRRPNVKAYARRLEYEVSIIEQKDFVDYFLFVSDMVRWSKDHGVAVGPARGSAAASLVCYLLRITEVDPLNPMYGTDLIFERFIDLTRVDLPDIDLDFDDERRNEVTTYLVRKYGQERVGHLGTFTTYKAKLALDDVSRVYKIPRWETERLKELLIVRSSGDLRASATIEDTVDMFPAAKMVIEEHPDLLQSTKLEGMVKGMGKHAAGAVVASEPLTEVSAVYGDKLAVDKYDAEYLNLLKIDNLGLNTIGMLAQGIEMLHMSLQDLYDLPLEDDETIKGFQEGDVTGIFQFDGRAMRLVNNDLKPDTFYEVCLVNALARPGPLHNGATMDYVDIKHGRKKPDFRHPLFDKITASTQYQVVYQEQILRIVREIGNFDWTHAAYIRKIISRKIGDQEFNRQWKRFYAGAKANGMDQATAKKIWGMCITAGSYAFNVAHAVSYGLIGWWCMWMKRHHPHIFYTVALQRLPESKSLEIMRDAVKHGIRILPPDPALSGITWTPYGKHSIRAGFKQVPTLGLKTADAIIEWRSNGRPKKRLRWDDLIEVKGIGPKTIQTIVSFCSAEDPLGVNVLDRQMEKVVMQLERGKLGDIPVPTHRAAEIPTDRGEDVRVRWMGVVTARNLRDLFEVNFRRTGEPLNPSKVDQPDKREWVVMYGFDGDETLTLRIDRFRYKRFKEAVWNLKLGRDLVLVEGVKRGNTPMRLVNIEKLWVFE
jgi:DNA polymerase-3 subunit alpha